MKIHKEEIEKQEANNSSEKPSKTAIVVIDAWRRALNQYPQYQHHFTADDIRLSEFIVNFLIPKLQYSSLITFSYFPNLLQSYLMKEKAAKGFDEHTLARKLLVKRKIAHAIDNGAKQIINFASGYDYQLFLASRNHFNVNFYDAERDTTQKLKVEALKKYCQINNISISISETKSATKFNDNFTCVNWDLTKNYLLELKEHGFDPQQKTLIIMEAVTGYLSEEVNIKLLKDFQKTLKEEDELLITYFPKMTLSIQSQKALEESNERILFALESEEIINFTSKYGFEVREKGLHPDLLDQIGAKEAADFHRQNETGKTNFYLLSPSIKPEEELNKKSISDIPDIILNISPKYDDKNRCLIS
jgi:O-methyltransferase involved in polyketide biosynthesis